MNIRPNARGSGMLLSVRIKVDQETYERLVCDAVGSPHSIPERAGIALRRAYDLPPRAAELKTAPSGRTAPAR